MVREGLTVKKDTTMLKKAIWLSIISTVCVLADSKEGKA